MGETYGYRPWVLGTAPPFYASPGVLAGLCLDCGLVSITGMYEKRGWKLLKKLSKNQELLGEIKMNRKYLYVKRAADIILSLTGLIILAPILFFISVAVKLESKGPILFRQKRVGMHKTYFEILKFRTMCTEAPRDCPTHMLHNPETYITKVGAFLRKYSLDELPQLWNILIGDMSIIGPRPALWNQENLILERERYKANDIRPGLTGWAQIHGRDELDIYEKAELDGIYIKKMGLKIDVSCFIKTVFYVLGKKGIREGKIKSKNNRKKG